MLLRDKRTKQTMDTTTQQPTLVLCGTGKTDRRVVQRLQARDRRGAGAAAS